MMHQSPHGGALVLDPASFQTSRYPPCSRLGSMQYPDSGHGLVLKLKVPENSYCGCQQKV